MLVGRKHAIIRMFDPKSDQYRLFVSLVLVSLTPADGCAFGAAVDVWKESRHGRGAVVAGALTRIDQSPMD